MESTLKRAGNPTVPASSVSDKVVKPSGKTRANDTGSAPSVGIPSMDTFVHGKSAQCEHMSEPMMKGKGMMGAEMPEGMSPSEMGEDHYAAPVNYVTRKGNARHG